MDQWRSSVSIYMNWACRCKGWARIRGTVATALCNSSIDTTLRIVLRHHRLSNPEQRDQDDELGPQQPRLHRICLTKIGQPKQGEYRRIPQLQPAAAESQIPTQYENAETDPGRPLDQVERAIRNGKERPICRVVLPPRR